MAMDGEMVDARNHPGQLGDRGYENLGAYRQPVAGRRRGGDRPADRKTDQHDRPGSEAVEQLSGHRSDVVVLVDVESIRAFARSMSPEVDDGGSVPEPVQK